jgi:hypothetical protein
METPTLKQYRITARRFCTLEFTVTATSEEEALSAVLSGDFEKPEVIDWGVLSAEDIGEVYEAGTEE